MSELLKRSSALHIIFTKDSLKMKVASLKPMTQFDVQFNLLSEQAFESQNEQLRQLQKLERSMHPDIFKRQGN